MSVDQTKLVDAIGVDSATGAVMLTISDHLEWSEKDDHHLLLLQEKINTYLRFVESGEILETYPNAQDRRVVINIVCKYPLNQYAKGFFDQAVTIVRGAGMELKYELFNAN